MKNTFSLIICLLLLATLASAQVFNHSYLPSNEDPAYGNSKPSSMIVDTDGATVSVHNIKEGASSFMPDAHDAHIIKVDGNGLLLWSMKYGGVGYDDQLSGICQTDDGGYLVVGSRGKIQNSYRNWLLKIDANGTKIWERLYFDQYNSELLLVERTSENDENYFIAGHRALHNSSLAPGYVLAMKVNQFGGPIWSNYYTAPDVVPVKNARGDIPTSMIQDLPNNGFVLAGLNTVLTTFGQNGNKRQSDLFTLGIDLNGAIYKDYQTYNVQGLAAFTSAEETEPDINLSLDDSGFVMAFGVGGFNKKQPILDKIAFMPLDQNLQAGPVSLYDPGRGRAVRGHSIYPDSEGAYAIGCTGVRTANTPYQNDDDRVSFLKISANGIPQSYINYHTQDNAGSSYMVQHGDGYMLKVDESVSNYASMGLIRTAANGGSACSQQRTINRRMAKAVVKRTHYGAVELGFNYLPFPATETDTQAETIGCSQQSATPEAKLAITALANRFTVYPNLVDAAVTEINLEIILTVEQSINIAVISPNGQLLKSYDYPGTKGINNYQLATEHLISGVNTIVLHSKMGKSAIARVVKL